jgi:MFS family permease
MTTATETRRPFRTDIPARLDRLPWSRWHWLVVVALGITWVIDGLEVTLVGAISTVLVEPGTLHLTPTQVGLLNTAYLVGAVLGALVFGYLTDRLGRKKLFTVTLGLYLVAAFLTAFSWNFASFAFFRFLTGAGIGGEYAAINSAIDELIPARVRGWADLAINGTFWLGAAIGSLATVVLLDPKWVPINLGWRLGFGIGAAVGLVVIFLRHWVPESPRWLLTHGRREEAERVVDEIEQDVAQESQDGPLPAPEGTINIRPDTRVGFGTIVATLIRTYPKRTALCLALVMSQAFLYNGVAFSFGLILRKYYEVEPDRVGLYLLPFALTNFLGPLVLGVVRRGGAEADDRRHARGLGGPADPGRVPVRHGPALGRRPDGALGGDLLLRLGGGQRGVPDRQRGLPAGDARAGHRPVLRRRDGPGRAAGLLAVRLADRYRLAPPAGLWRPAGGGAALGDGGDRRGLRGEGRAGVARADRDPAVGGRRRA